MRTKIKRCACGLPLHYRDKERESQIQAEIEKHGEWMPVSVGLERYLVQRHYKELHGINPNEIHSLMQKGIVRKNNQ
jgi:hypothetical protein